jgi:hypothetical protein
MRKKIKPKLRSYLIMSEAIEKGLHFALNRLEDTGAKITQKQRDAAIPNMLNEILVSLSNVVDCGDE